MKLRDFQYQRSYTRGVDKPLEDFLIPVLSLSNRFYYITGYFSSKMITLLSYGIKDFINDNNGKIKLIVGCLFLPDLSIINLSDNELKKKFMEVTESNFFSSEMEKSPEDIEPFRLLAWLLYNQRLKIKWGIPLKDTNLLKNSKGILHEKIGILKDKNSGDFVSFSGSMNATYYAWTENREEMKVFQSWVENSKDYAKDDLTKFYLYWNNKDHSLKILDFPLKLQEKIIQKYLPKNNNIDEINFELIDKIAQKQLMELATWALYEEFQSKDDWIYREGCLKRQISYITPRPHQKRALDFLKTHNYSAFLQMATGSGKTKTAIIASYDLYKKLKENKKRLLALVIVPDSYLVDQWFEELRSYTKNVVKCYSENRNWKNQLKTKISRLKISSIDHCFVVSTSASFKYDIWNTMVLNKLNDNYVKILFIGDEAHTLGAPTGQYLLNKLHINFEGNYKIGLSATPIREYDEIGTKLVLNWFSNKDSPNIFEFSLKEAQDNKILMKFNYFPIECYLNNSEFTEFEELTKKIGKKMALVKSEGKIAEELTVLLNLRADILKKAVSKLYNIQELIQSLLNDSLNENKNKLSKLVIFCKDGEQVKNVINGIKLVNRTLNLKNQIKFHTIDGRDKNVIRISRINDLIDNKINLLLVMKCLDRGVDIPALERAIFMSSSGTELEHIQRAGRLLRIEKNKKGFVEIFDFFVFPTDSQIIEHREICETIFRIEKKRINFFMELAENKEKIQDLMWHLETKFF